MINRRLTQGKPAPRVLPGGYPGAVLTDAPLAYYRTAVSSTVPDETGNGHDANLNGVSVIAGPVADAFTGFQSIPASIILPGSLHVNGDESITIEMIYRIANDGWSNSAFTIGNNFGTSPRCQAHMPYTNFVYWDYGDFGANGRQAANYAPYEDSAWHHVALVVDAHNPFAFGQGRQQIWVDGTKIAEGDWVPYGGGGNPSAQYVGGYIGSWPSSGVDPSRGDIAEFAIYDAALTPTQIATHIAAI